MKIYIDNNTGSIYAIDNDGSLVQCPINSNNTVDIVEEGGYWTQCDYTVLSNEEISYLDKIKTALK